MAREHFYGDEEKLRKRLLVLQELVAEQDLHEKPCPLLAAQLNELGVLCGRLQADIRVLAEAVQKAGYNAALSGTGPAEQQETPRPVPGVRFNG